MKYILQVYSGDRHTSGFRTDEITDRIKAIASGIKIDQVIIGWGTDAAAYRKIGAFLHGAGIRMILWLPVFSEAGEELRPDRATDIFGQPVAAPDGQPDDAFHFVCPSSAHNAQIVKDAYERYFSDCGFDGVFLDRVRGQSFAAGISGVLSCACANCRKAFQQKGVDIREVRQLYEEQGDAFFDVASWPMNGEFTLERPQAQRFFEAREEIIADAVTDIIRSFKSKGLIVGLDLFAPVVSRIVGQNYSLLAGKADFIKPMLYRRTEAPAGIGYEYALLRRHAPGARGIPALSMDRAFLDSQLRAVADLPCEIYPGVEINYDEELVRTDPAYIRESLAAIREHGIEGAALCWNVMQAPEQFLRTVAEGEKHDRA